MAFVCEQKSKKHTQGEASTKCRLEKNPLGEHLQNVDWRQPVG